MSLGDSELPNSSRTNLGKTESVVTRWALHFEVICFGWTGITSWTLSTVLLSSFAVSSIWTFYLLTGWGARTMISWRTPGAGLPGDTKFITLKTPCKSVTLRNNFTGFRNQGIQEIGVKLQGSTEGREMTFCLLGGSTNQGFMKFWLLCDRFFLKRCYSSILLFGTIIMVLPLFYIVYHIMTYSKLPLIGPYTSSWGVLVGLITRGAYIWRGL